MAKFALVDLANLFSRVRHVVKGSLEDRVGLSTQIAFQALRKLHRNTQFDHVVLCLEGGSWRNDIYPMYKGKRRADRAAKLLDPKEREEEEAFDKAQKDFAEFFIKDTCCTVLQVKSCEGDDLIARWIQLHPTDEHIILTSDSDFVQLLSPNVSIYNGVTETFIREDGVFDIYGTRLWFEVKPADGKISFLEMDKAKEKHDYKEKEKSLKKKDYEPKPFEWNFEPEWYKRALFVKLIRGDTSDSVFSAYPGVRYNGSSNRVGIAEAWEDRNDKTWAWNQFMNSTWEKNGVTVKVRDEYEMNYRLIGLSELPEDVCQRIDAAVLENISREMPTTVGIRFMKMCGRMNLPTLRGEASDHAKYLMASYRGIGR